MFGSICKNWLNSHASYENISSPIFKISSSLEYSLMLMHQRDSCEGLIVLRILNMILSSPTFKEMDFLNMSTEAWAVSSNGLRLCPGWRSLLEK